MGRILNVQIIELIDQGAEGKGNFGYESALLEVLPFVIARMNKLNAHF